MKRKAKTPQNIWGSHIKKGQVNVVMFKDADTDNYAVFDNGFHFIDSKGYYFVVQNMDFRKSNITKQIFYYLNHMNVKGFDKDADTNKIWMAIITKNDKDKITKVNKGYIILKGQNKINYKNIKLAKANVTPVRQRTQYTCMATSLTMCLQALGRPELNEDTVNKIMGAAPMQGAAWENVIAASQHFGFRTVLVTPCTVPQLKEWTDKGIPVMIAWNPEGRDWSHASVVFDVDADGNVSVADPNIPDPEETVRIVPKDEFYHKWFEKWPDYLVRRPACAVMTEITPDGKQVTASRDTNPLCRKNSPYNNDLCPKNKGETMTISEEENTLTKTAYEISVDNKGYAHNDEGDTWYVGRQYSGGTYSLKDLPRAPSNRGPQNQKAQIKDIQKLLDKKTGTPWETKFLKNILAQLVYSKSLSFKQKNILQKTMKKYKMANVENHLTATEILGQRWIKRRNQ